AAGWRWNADDDTGARALFQELVRRFPASPQAADALYALGRIDQEAGDQARAAASYAELAERFPDTALGDEARWRTGWIRYLAGDPAEAAARFRRLTSGTWHASASYGLARSLERLGQQGEAHESLARLVDEHPTSYYAELADARLGHAPTPGPPPAAPTPAPFPAELAGPHAERARLLATLGFPRFARL